MTAPKKQDATMMPPLPRRLAQECRALERLAARVCPQGLGRDEEILSFMLYDPDYDWDFADKFIKDASGKWIVNPSPDPRHKQISYEFGQLYLYRYFFLTGQYEQARKALYYALYIDSSERSGDYFIYADPTPTIDFYEQGSKNWQTFIYSLDFNFYCLYYPFMSQYPWFPELVRKSEEKGKEMFLKARQEHEKRPWHYKMLGSFRDCDEYLEWLLLRRDMDQTRAVWREYFDWYDWHQAQHPPARYREGADLGRCEWLPLVGAVRHWFAALDEPARREELARASLERFHQWCLRDFVIDRTIRTIIDFPHEILLSFMMRIELGVDLELSRRFVRCFKPMFRAVPPIWEKVEALGVDYAELEVLPDEQIEAVRRRCEPREQERRARYNQILEEIMPLRDQLERESIESISEDDEDDED